MIEIKLIKVTSEYLRPATKHDADLLDAFKSGAPLTCKITKMSKRNYGFHQKWWTLVEYAYEHWEPGQIETSDGYVTPQKTLENFRKDMIILAGYYNSHFTVDGGLRIEAKSISFGSMDQDEFEKLYSATIDAVLEHVLANYTNEDLDSVVMNILGYT
jgi:hypothetical protein